MLLPLSLLHLVFWQSALAQVNPLPPLKLHEELSFKKQPVNYLLSGHTATLPSTDDYVRLVPDQPLAFGGFFTADPIPFQEFVIDVAFRIHSEGGESPAHRGGGRGVGMWYTKKFNPTDITYNRDLKMWHNPPSFFPEPAIDSAVSLFGNSNPFEGLGVIFDSAPSLPLQKRSENATYHRQAADDLGVVSGIMDDATSDWLESPIVTPGKEAKYLSNAIGDCAANYRNSPGLIWARISHYNHKISVHLDMSPHNTLSMSGKQFKNPCFEIDGVSLPKGYHFGITGLASANPTPDAVDIYAVEVWEVLATEKDDEYQDRMQQDASQLEEPLDGLEDHSSAESITAELLATQIKVLEAIDTLSNKVNNLEYAIAKMSNLPASAQAQAQTQKATGSSNQDDYFLQQVQKVAAQIQTLQNHVENFQSKTSGTLSVLSSRMAETFALVHRTSEDLVSKSKGASNNSSIFSIALYVVGAALIGIVGLAVYRVAKKRNSPRGKKLI